MSPFPQAEQFSILTSPVKFGKLNVDDNSETSARFNIRGIPTLLLFKNGEVKDQIVGATTKDHIKRVIDAQL